MLSDLEEGKLEDSDVFAALAHKFKQYKQRVVTAVAPNDLEIKGAAQLDFLRMQRQLPRKPLRKKGGSKSIVVFFNNVLN